MGRRGRPLGVVLAGGEGRRLGGGKAVVALDGRPLLAYPLAALREALTDVAVVAKRSTALPPLDAGVAIWLEPDEPRHPMAGVVRALREARGRPVVVVAVDMPLVDAGLLRRIAAAPARGGALAVVPRAGGRLQPLCARYEPGALAALAGFDPADRATDLAGRLAPAVLECADEDAFANVNAPEDLLRASALLHARTRRGR
ncbi:MAG TPA: molybdenum cofactor guanylyltransferase [Solirubrobacteraceae bacterium]|nr:molybdenum cofactor guanylyltransferase [Solirubrobacteraceae bacterium]